MAHPVGERLHCDECGAEILFLKESPCAHVCCGKEMRSLGVDEEMVQRLGVEAEVEPARPEASH